MRDLDLEILPACFGDLKWFWDLILGVGRIDPSLDCVQGPVWIALIFGLVSDGEIKNANLMGDKSEMDEGKGDGSKNKGSEEDGEFEI